MGGETPGPGILVQDTGRSGEGKLQETGEFGHLGTVDAKNKLI